MYRGVEIRPPFFEVGPKAYAFGPDVLDLAKRADVLGDAVEHALQTKHHGDVVGRARTEPVEKPQALLRE